jgi:hypothetical protein
MNMADTPHQRAAKKLWPAYRVENTGQYAVVCPLLQLVQLHEFALWANVAAQESHSNWRCAGQHKICVIKPDYQTGAQLNYRPAAIERD